MASPTWALDIHESLFGETGTGILAMVPLLPLMLATSGLLYFRLTTIRRLLWALVFGSIPGSFLTIQNAIAGVRYNENAEGYYMGFEQPDIFSPILVVCGIFLLVCLGSAGTKRLSKLLAGVLLPLNYIALLLTGIRSGWVASLVVIVVFLVHKRSFLALGGILAAGAFVALLGFATANSLDLGDKLSARFSHTSMHSGELRLEFWEVAAEGFAQRPILGIGWGCFPVFVADHTVGRAAATHNIYMRVLCELGVVGFAFFLAWVVITALKLRGNPEALLVGLLMTGVLVQGIFLDLFLCTYFYIFLGICDSFCRGNIRFDSANARQIKITSVPTTLKPAAG